jgi:hypothetical protein
VQQSLTLLRVLRNACAAGPAAAEVLQASGVHVHAAQLAAAIAHAQVQVTTLDPEQCKEQRLLLLTVLQLLANMCAASAEGAAAVWTALYPERLQSILAVPEGNHSQAMPLHLRHCHSITHNAAVIVPTCICMGNAFQMRVVLNHTPTY